jgi:hypothetical protein
MLLLTSTSDIVRVTTSAAGDIQVHTSFVDNNAGTITPDRRNWNISTATTTTVVPSPGASTQRNVKGLYITNNSATVTNFVEVQHFDGTTSSELMGVTLLPGENLVLREDGSWAHRDANGGEYGYTPVVVYPYAPTGYKAESIPRTLSGVNIASAGSGVLVMQAIWLPAGTVINNLITMSGSTASATQTNRWMALYDQNRSLIQQGPNSTTTVIAANTLWTSAITPYTATYSGIYYIGIMTAATTPNTLIGYSGGLSAVRNLAPVLSGTSTTALTTTAPNPAAAISATANTYWVAVS